jgi:hypothetical protein
MSAPTFETINTEGIPSGERHLPSEISRRIIFRLAPSETATPFTLDDADKFARALHGDMKGRSDYLIGVAEGKYVIDFPNSSPVRAAERIATVLFNGFGDSYANAVLDQARVDMQESQTTSPTGEAWLYMQDATKPVDRIMNWKQAQLMSNVIEHVRYNVA